MKRIPLQKQFENAVNDNIGYLRETVSECESISDQQAMEFAEWLNKNRWYNFDGQFKKWCYTFEHGTSISRASYEKNYMKTTEELLSLFKAEHYK